MKKMTNMKKWIVGVVLMLTTIVGIGQEVNKVRFVWTEGSKTITTVYNPDNVLKYRNPNLADSYIFDIGIKKDSISPKEVNYSVYASSNQVFDNPMFAFGMGKGGDPKYITPYGDCKFFELITFNGESTSGKDTFPYIECKVSRELLELFKADKIKTVSIYHTWNKEDHGDPIIKCGTYFKDFIAKY